ncbi:CPBP family intramembrane metalloprotease [Amnibacterium sp. CER49]|uniref:CPBP family intramembrane glutamic endopeptidase n=1 Tax=Amnibacterium sp. CER49 TaxID=3039161 RepID=UPI00244C252F|nr:CPBP family intramembrane metalloprotease [Amnibacterium sp. CER49]MDH2444482.1 CPBP family intramembrane metalloprotease [Amnibacterium sp. CER49]
MTATPVVPAAGRALGETVALLAWAAGVLLVVWFVAFPLVRDDWQAAGLQVVAYVVTLLPALLLRPPARLPAGARRIPAIVAAAVLVAGLAVAVGTGGWTGLPRHVVTAGSAGIGEELLFRGVLWDRLTRVLPGPLLLVAVDAALFAVYHVPSVIVQHEPGRQLLITFGFGVLFAGLRVASRGLVLPTAVHVAVDLSS